MDVCDGHLPDNVRILVKSSLLTHTVLLLLITRRYVDDSVPQAGCTGCTCTPRAEKKLFWANLHEKIVSAPPGGARVKFFRTFFAGRGRFGGWKWLINSAVLACRHLHVL